MGVWLLCRALNESIGRRKEGSVGSCRARWKFGKLGGKPGLQTGQASVGSGVWWEAAVAAWEGSKVGAGSVKVASLDFRNGLEMGSEDTGFRACFVGILVFQQTYDSTRLKKMGGRKTF